MGAEREGPAQREGEVGRVTDLPKPISRVGTSAAGKRRLVLLAVLAGASLIDAGPAQAYCSQSLNQMITLKGLYQPVPWGMAYGANQSAEFMLVTKCNGQSVRIDVVRPAGGMPICRLTGRVLVQGVLSMSGAAGYGDFSIVNPVLVQCQ